MYLRQPHRGRGMSTATASRASAWTNGWSVEPAWRCACTAISRRARSRSCFSLVRSRAPALHRRGRRSLFPPLSGPQSPAGPSDATVPFQYWLQNRVELPILGTGSPRILSLRPVFVPLISSCSTAGTRAEHDADAKRKELLAGYEIKKIVSFKQRRGV